jgi:hypothetical protein
MIDWIEKLPDTMVGFLIAAGLWFAFNYAVLAERAMEKDHAAVVVPRCIAVLDQHESARRAVPSGLGQIFGMPELDGLESMLIARAQPRPLTPAEKMERCRCAAGRAARDARFDYAVHTASFRIITPQSVGALREEAARIALDGLCGAIPHWKPGE